MRQWTEDWDDEDGPVGSWPWEAWAVWGLIAAAVLGCIGLVGWLLTHPG